MTCPMNFISQGNSFIHSAIFSYETHSFLSQETFKYFSIGLYQTFSSSPSWYLVSNSSIAIGSSSSLQSKTTALNFENCNLFSNIARLLPSTITPSCVIIPGIFCQYNSISSSVFLFLSDDSYKKLAIISFHIGVSAAIL